MAECRPAHSHLSPAKRRASPLSPSLPPFRSQASPLAAPAPPRAAAAVRSLPAPGSSSGSRRKISFHLSLDVPLRGGFPCLRCFPTPPQHAGMSGKGGQGGPCCRAGGGAGRGAGACACVRVRGCACGCVRWLWRGRSRSSGAAAGAARRSRPPPPALAALRIKIETQYGGGGRSIARPGPRALTGLRRAPMGAGAGRGMRGRGLPGTALRVGPPPQRSRDAGIPGGEGTRPPPRPRLGPASPHRLRSPLRWAAVAELLKQGFARGKSKTISHCAITSIYCNA
ncbi:cuticle collagen 19-like [Manacus candei]|uniref:cuticle collagen 19-like n=1 Tax=Manacus candei TaxID=415023 RepID=UPI0022271E16|nr:cuticle collagen 19-like [Manacus candei]